MTVSVVIGRFQVPRLHDGHRALLRHAVTKSRALLILLGVSPLDERCAENPLSFLDRKFMIESFFNSDGAGGATITVLPLPNQRCNDEWSRRVDELIHLTYPNATVTLYCGRDSFKPYYTGIHPVEEYVSCMQACSGTALRSSLENDGSPQFLAGKAYSLQQQYPHAYPTVDVALANGSDVLLIQRADTGVWCFPGGFVDALDGSLEQAVRREVSEELGLHVESPQYVGSFKIKDWRYRGRDGIITSFFTGYATGILKLNPREVRDVRWVSLHSRPSDLAAEHQPLMSALMERYGRGVR